MKQRPRPELDARLGAYAALVRRYASALDLMSAEGLRDLDRWIDEAGALAEVVGRLSPAPERVLDVGSGAGLPGIVVAATYPELAVELIERRRRRGAFLRMALAAVEAPRAEVQVADAADVPGPPVQAISAQAVGDWRDVYAWTRHRHDTAVTLVGRKGPDAADTVRALAEGVSADLEVVEERPLEGRGTLLAVRLPGGLGCRSSA